MTAQHTRTFAAEPLQEQIIPLSEEFSKASRFRGLCRMGKRFKPLNPLPTLFVHNFKLFLLTTMFPCSSAQKF